MHHTRDRNNLMPTRFDAVYPETQARFVREMDLINPWQQD